MPQIQESHNQPNFPLASEYLSQLHFLDRCCQSEGGQMQNSNRMTKQHLGQHCYLSSTDFQFVLDFLSIVFLFSVPAFFMTQDYMESKRIDLKPSRL